MIVALVPAAACFAAAYLVLVRELSPERRAVRASIKRAADYGAPVAERPEAQRPTLQLPTGAVLRLTRNADLDAVARRLRAAGVGRGITPQGYVALKFGLVAAGVVVGGFLGDLGGGASAVIAALAGGALGLGLPDQVLAARTRARREAIATALPNALDLLAITVEAGLGLDAAIAKLADATSGPLSEELVQMLGEIRAGETRHGALRRLADRTGVPEVGAFARAIARAEQLGAPLGRTLRMHADEARLRRQAAAEERAGRAPVRMLFPTVFLIFPGLFVVVLGPALLMLARAL